MRTKYLDPDFRRTPKTSHFCCACQKDLLDGQAVRFAYVLPDGFEVVHPEDAAEATSTVRLPIGNDCARKIGLEWTTLA